MRRLFGLIIASSILCTCWNPARADSVSFTVTLDTSPLQALQNQNSSDGPFYADFQLSGTNGNSVTINNFSFGGGAVAGAGQTIGDSSGDLTQTVSLDSAGGYADNELYQQVTFGQTLSFQVMLDVEHPSANVGSADTLFFNILDGSLFNIPTQDSTYNDLVSASLVAGGPLLSAFGNDPNSAPLIFASDGSTISGDSMIGSMQANVQLPNSAAAPLPPAGIGGFALLIAIGSWRLWRAARTTGTRGTIR